MQSEGSKISYTNWKIQVLDTNGLVVIQDANKQILPEPFELIIQSKQMILQMAQKGDYRVTVLDMLGRKLKSSKILAGRSLTLSTVYLPSGLYFLKIYNGKKSFGKKFFVL